MCYSCRYVLPRKQTLYIVAKESTKSSAALRAPTAKQILANGRGVVPGVSIFNITRIIPVSLSGLKYSYKQEYVSLVNRQFSQFCSQAYSLIFQTDLEMWPAVSIIYDTTLRTLSS